MRIPFFFAFLWAYTAHAQLNLQQLAHVPNDSGITLAGCWHYVDSSQNEYALVGHRQGLDIYDVTVPTQPLRRFRVPGLTSNWREVKVWNGFAYVGSEAEGSGITIIDLRQLPDTVYYKVFTGEGLMDSLIQRSHTVGAVDGYLYVYGSTAPNDGAVIFALDDPWNPVYVGQYNINYLHDGFVRGNTLWGSEIYEGQFSVIDITDRSNPVLLTNQPTPGLFNHNSELSKNGDFLFTTDEKPFVPLGAFKVSDLSNIELTDVYYPSQRPVGEVHNVRVMGDDYLVCPSYQGQLTIVDASDPYNLVETAWAILGASLVWDANPYLPSGIVFATAKVEGFYIFQPTYQRAARLQGTVTDAVTGQPLLDAKVFVLTTANADTTDINGWYATGAPTTDAYTISVERAGYEPKILLVNLVAGEVVNLNLALQPATIGTHAPATAVWARAYPTVAKDWLNLEINAQIAAEAPVFTLLDLYGRTVQTTTLGTQTTAQVPLSVPAGVYIGAINGKACFKVVVRT